jgi:GT2 family glycosyltransferase
LPQASDKSEVAVVVVNWNRKALLRAALESVFRQQGCSFSVYVVDNASTDGSAEMVSTEFPRVRLLKMDRNLGFCAGNNRAIEITDEPYVVLLNNDAEAQPGWLASLVQTAAQNSDIGMVASKIVSHQDPTRIDKVGHLIYLDGQNRGRGSGQSDVGQFDRPEEILWPDGCAALYRRKMLDQIGLFDEDLFAYADDAELGLRGRWLGWRCVYQPKAVVWHHRGQTLGPYSGRRLELIERNRVLLAAKLFPWSLLWLNVPLYLMRIGAGALAALRGRGEAANIPGWKGKWLIGKSLLKGDWEAIQMLPLTWNKRRAFQPKIRLTHREQWQLLWKHRITLKELSEQSL